MFDYPHSPIPEPGPRLACLPEPAPDRLIETVVALANSDGGAVWIGLDADGFFCRATMPAEVAPALEQVGARCTPLLSVGRAEPVELPGGPVVVVRVTRSARVHALHDGRVVARIGRENAALDSDGIRRLLADRANGDFEAESVPGATGADLDPALLDEFRARWAEQGAYAPGLAADDLLAALGAPRPDGAVTVAGLLLLGRAPQHRLPHTGVRIVRSVSRATAGREGPPPALDETIGGPLPRLIAAAWAVIRAQVWLADEPGDTAQGGEYPPASLYEALVNAVIHRDYRLRREPVTVRIFPDRVEFSSPGGLPGFVTREQLGEICYRRNPRLAWGLWLMGGAAGTGSGFRRLRDEVDRHGCPPPDIFVRARRVTLRLRGARPGAQLGTAATSADQLNPRQVAALHYVAEHGSITFRQLCARYDRVRPELLQRDLADLVARGLLRRVGSRTNVYYIRD